MFVDFHTHTLPGIDDGAQNIDMSLAMLTLLKKQGTDIVVSTPHYYAHRQPVDEFLKNRQFALETVLSQNAKNIPTIMTGAEVYLEHGLRNQNLRPFCIEKTPYILVEMPYAAYQSWMLEEVYTFCLQQSLIPIFAHLDRYLPYFTSEIIQEILDFDDAIIQINNEALFNRKSLKKVIKWIKEGRTVITGSDTHNMSSRAPDNDHAQAVLKSKLGKLWLEKYSDFVESFLGVSE